MSPAEEKALLQQGIAAARAGDKPAARARFRELTGKNFDNELAWLWLASVADTPAHAMACLRRVLQINEGNDKARAALFRLLMEKGIEAARANDKSSAYALFQEACALDPASELVWTWLASTAPAPTAALAALRKVLQLNAGHEQAARAFKKLIVQQSVELAQAGDAGARDLLTEATTVDPENETLWLWLARSVPSGEAAPLYDRVLQINPSNDAARAALRQLRPSAAMGEAEAMLDEPTAPDLESELEADFDAELEAADLDEDLATPALPFAGQNGHANGHGHANDHANGHSNGHASGQANGFANGAGNGLANGYANGQANGHGRPDEGAGEAGEYAVSDSHELDGRDADGSRLAHRTGLGQKSSHAIDLSQLNLEEEPASVRESHVHGVSAAAAVDAAPVQYETNADYSGATYAEASAVGSYTTDNTAFTTSSDYPGSDGLSLAGTSYTGAPAGLIETNGYQAADVDSYVAASEQTYADSASQAYALSGASSSVGLLGSQEIEVTRNNDYGDYAAHASSAAASYGVSTEPVAGLVLNADAAAPVDGDYGSYRLDEVSAESAASADSYTGSYTETESESDSAGDAETAAGDADSAAGSEVATFAADAELTSEAASEDAQMTPEAAVAIAAEAAMEEAVAPAPSVIDPSSEPAASASAPVVTPALAPVGSILGVSQIVPAPSPVTNGRSAWDCPICLSGAPEGAVRCPNCGSVVTLDDPDLLLQTDDVDRRHVLQVVARLKNRAAGSDQFDHQFTLGLAYINANRMTEGLGHLRMASQLRPRDQRLKGQIDALERRAAQGVRRAKASAPAASPAAPPAAATPSAFKPASPVAPVDPPVSSASSTSASTESQASESSADVFGESAAAGASAPSTGASDNRRLILVVDDSPTIQKVVSVTLEAHGHEVVTASDGMEALAKLRTMKPDLVLLDITMPHMDGYQLCRILRSNDLTRQVPIVMLSGKDGLFDKMRGRMAGAATYITKPFAPSALPPLVEKYCKRVG